MRPTWFFAVPRIWEKLKAGMEAMIEAEHDAERKRALQVGARRGPPEGAPRAGRARRCRRSWPRSTRKADELVLSKIRAQLGLDEAEIALRRRGARRRSPVLEFFHAIGIPVAELWGLSESCGCGAVNLPGKIKLGTRRPGHARAWS